jgi:EAL domain-containing protein (putative c-di-GMP-specific phosphodiesterase class I)
VGALLEFGYVLGGERLFGFLNVVGAAEQCGLILTISHWVLQEACAQAREWLIAGINLRRLAVNLSGAEFKAPYEVETDLDIALAQNGLPPALLEIEVRPASTRVRPRSNATRRRVLRR